MKDKELNNNKEADLKAVELINRGFKQVSGRFRLVACLKPGIDPLEYLKQHEPVWYESILEGFKNHLLRTDCDAVDRLELTEEEFKSFKKSGGETA